MKKFLFGFGVGIVIMVYAGQWWVWMPTFFGGRWDITTPNPLVSNPFTLWCNTLIGNVQTFGNVTVTIVQNGKPVQNLTINLSVERPAKADHPGAAPEEFKIPNKACFVATNSKGMATFSNVPARTVYLFFNNDAEAYPKRFGVPNWTITPVEVKQGETTSVTIDLHQ